MNLACSFAQMPASIQNWEMMEQNVVRLQSITNFEIEFEDLKNACYKSIAILYKQEAIFACAKYPPSRFSNAQPCNHMVTFFTAWLFEAWTLTCRIKEMLDLWKIEVFYYS